MARIVLVADDSATIQKRAMGILKSEGYEVETVSNGVAAIKRLAVVQPAVIIADVCMPGRDGYEVCEHVKKTPEFSHIRVVLLISDMEPYDSAKGTAVKADGILKKPFEGRELISLVDKLADESEAAASAVEEVSIAPPAAAAPALEEFEVSSEPDSTPTIIQPPEPDFSAHASGVAFAEAASEDAPAFPLEHQADIGNFPFGTQEAGGPSLHENDFEFPTLQAEEPSLRESAQAGPALDEPAISAPSAEETPAFLDSLRGTPEPPVFVEESHAPAAEASSAALRTAIFRTPIEIADPIWKEEAPPEAKDAAASTLEPQFIAEDLDVSALGDHDHTHPHPHDHEHPEDNAAEQMHDHVHGVNATNLGSFSLDAAAAGQVRFNAELPEVVYADEQAEASALAAPAPETAPEASAIPEVVYAEASSEEVALEAPAAPEAASSEPITDAAEPPAALEAPLEVVYSHDDAPLETVAEKPHDEIGATESKPLTGEAEVLAGSVAEESEPAPAESAHEAPAPEVTTEAGDGEIHREETVPEATAESAPAAPEEKPVPAPVAAEVAAPEQVAAEVANPAPVAGDLAAPEPVAAAVAVQQHPPVEEPKPQEAPEPAAMAPAPAPKPAVDHELVLSIVHKVVAHMAPSFLGDEAKADMAKRLAEKIAAELNPQAPFQE